MAHHVLQIGAAIMEWSSGHWQTQRFLRKVYYRDFAAELKTLRDWKKYTSSPTSISGQGPTRMAPASFLTRSWQETLFRDAR